MQFEESDWRSMGAMRSNLNLFRTLFGPGHFRANAEVIENVCSLDCEISNADMAEIDVIFDRQGAITLPPSWLED
jgi:hypothetical protein